MDVEDILREEIRLLQKQLYDETHHTTLVITRLVRGSRFTKIIIPTKEELINWYYDEVLPSSTMTAKFVNSKGVEVDRDSFITNLEAANI